jgi:hypothetical protein
MRVTLNEKGNAAAGFRESEGCKNHYRAGRAISRVDKHLHSNCLNLVILGDEGSSAIHYTTKSLATLAPAHCHIFYNRRAFQHTP